VYTLLDLFKFDLHALGSKRNYTPRDIVNLTLTSKTPFTQYFKGTNMNFCIGEIKFLALGNMILRD
jgi:hypothetical protein